MLLDPPTREFRIPMCQHIKKQIERNPNKNLWHSERSSDPDESALGNVEKIHVMARCVRFKPSRRRLGIGGIRSGSCPGVFFMMLRVGSGGKNG